MKLFLFSNTIRTFLKNYFNEYQHRPEVQIHLDAKIKQELNKNQGEKQKLNAVLEKANTR
jgi:sulfur relay (sulfurtransferase) DsrC/TusE family protein